MSRPIIWAIQHVAFETLDGFEPVLEQAGFEVRYLMACDDLSLIEGGAALVVLGGPISANDEVRYPFLTQELHLIEIWLKAERPILGICLGAQLLAKVIGGRVQPGTPEIGFADIAVAKSTDAEILAPFRSEPLAFHWHGDHIELPKGTNALAWSDACATQAFAANDQAIGLQFHSETRLDRIELWLLGHASELFHHGIDVCALRQDALHHAQAMAVKTQAVAEEWISRCLR